ncbi:flagellar hook-length control protein FliK [Bosea sp. (in: a-proteobacteria)]|uniref:flagellar hook-length control protein FliK n=1 Tax=Bosea sp. (in: a-proteobacteria) TaxID=1871050 RepID=UPI00261D3161|nr:flagellar hook-length control protein FliK [Bosea sp. (in: a-proteobacteria)]MCO5091878.1 flagellar hook-length control protein FliK [Bosea sp. (in: a-proteobacteria)]
MNLAQLVKSQTFATLLQALDAAGELTAGRTVEARLSSLEPDGTATAMIGDSKVALVLAGTQARQAALQPGTTLMLRLDPPDEPGGDLRATLIETRPPQPASRTQASTGSPAPDPAAASNPAASARALAGPLLGPVLQRQAGLAPLFANLRAVAEGSVSLSLPKTLLPAIDRILAQAVPAERQAPTAATLKQAFQGSGLFLDTRQAAGLPAPRQGDLKAGLQALRETLLPIVDALSPEPKTGSPARRDAPAAQEPADQSARPAPPRRDGPLLAQPAAAPSLTAGEKPLAIATTLLDQTEAALDRIKLTQYASLPADTARPDGTQPGGRWLAEIPVAFQHGTAILPLQVEREAPRRDAQGLSPPLWRIRFALDVEPMGPLQGVVTLQGRDVGVSLWAEREETSRLLRGAAQGLEGALLDADFASGAVDVHTGQPRVMQPTAGQFLDRLS